MDGEPGDAVYAILGTNTLFTPMMALQDALLLDVSQPPGLIFLGIVPPTGQLTTTAVAPELGVGVDGQLVLVQSIVLSDGGFVTLGAGTSTVLLDAAF